MPDLPRPEVVDKPNRNGAAMPNPAEAHHPAPHELTAAELAQQTAERLLQCAQSVVQGAGEAARRYLQAQDKIKQLSAPDQDKLSRYVTLLGAGAEFETSNTEERKKYQKELGEFGLENDLSSFHIREAAHKAILQMGAPACPYLEKELKNEDPEIKRHAADLLNENIGQGGLITIKRDAVSDDSGMGRIGAGMAIGAVNRLGALGAIAQSFDIDFDTRQDKQFKVEQARKFAEDPKLTEKRVEQVDQLLAQCTLGKLHLSPERLKDLQTEMKNLKQIAPLCAALEIDLASAAASDRDYEATKSALNSAFKHDKKLIKSEEVIHLILRCGFDVNDSHFMEAYKQAGGDPNKVAKMRADLDEQKRRWNQSEVPNRLAP